MSPAATDVPLTWQDQSVLDLEGASDPWNIQLEIAARGEVEVDRLGEAVAAACRRHPLMRARLDRGSRSASRSAWRLVDDAEVSVRLVTLGDQAELDRLRTDLYSERFDLTTSAPLRVVVARREGYGDLVMFDAAHPVVDGIGLLRLLRSVTRHYRGLPDPGDPVSIPEARDLRRLLAPTTAGEVGRRLLEGPAKLVGAGRAPARVASSSTDARRGAGFAHRTVAAGVVAEVNRARPAGATLNDVLLATAMTAVETWNGRLGESADKVQLFVPVNLRPAAWSTEMVMNMFSYVSVATTGRERGDLAATTRAVTRRTHPGVRTGRTRGTQDLLRLVAPVPLGVKAAMPHLLTLTGHRLVDTAVVSNLGRPDDVPSFDDAGPAALHFTPPYWSAASVSIGAVSTGGDLHVGLRHRLTTLDHEAGGRFADLLVETFTSLAAA